MKNKSIVYFLTGFTFGIVLIILLGAYPTDGEPCDLLKGRPQKFGDLEINVMDIDSNDTALVISKDNKIFFYAEKCSEGKVNQIAITGPNNEVRFTMYASDKEGLWKNASYMTERDRGYWYLDKDYDGRFDVMASDIDGDKYKTQYIFIDPNFIKVDFIKDNKAGNKDGSYIFKDSTSWQKE